MSQTISPSTTRIYGLERVCLAWDVPRSTYYSRQKTRSNAKRGPRPKISDQELLSLIKKDIEHSPFKGEGHRKVHARLKRKKVRATRNRVLRIMRENDLLSPQRRPYSPPNKHDGIIVTDAPNIMWCTDGTKIFTVNDGWVWLFTVEEHWNAECLGWHVCKNGDRFGTLEPVTEAVKRIYGALNQGIAQGLKLRSDHGTQYTSDYFLEQIRYMGIEESFGLVRQPQTNGVVERFNRTLKEQVINGRIFHTIEEVREVVSDFVEQYNHHWLLEKLGYKSPLETRQEYNKLEVAA